MWYPLRNGIPLMLMVFIALCSSFNSASAYSVNPDTGAVPPKGSEVSRRSTFILPLAFAAAACTGRSAYALDMDAFANQQLAGEACNEKTDKKCKPKLSDDAALCRFGSPSPETGAACLRAGMPTDRPGSPVDAFGKIDRGDYLRCKSYYVDGPSGKLEKQWRCQ